MSSSEYFKIECPECSVDHETAGFQAATEFVDKHKEHTGHEMEWVEAEFNEEFEPEEEWHVDCRKCDSEWVFESKGSALDFIEEHSTYTDHEIQGPPRNVVSGVSSLTGTDSRSVRQFLVDLESVYEDGVPATTIYSQVSGEPARLAKVRHEIEQLKSMGEVYEPRAGYLSTV